MAKGYWLAIKQYRTGWLTFVFTSKEDRAKMLEAISYNLTDPACPNEIRIYESDLYAGD